MPWAWNDAIDENVDWSDITFISQFWEAFDERMQAISRTGFPLPAVIAGCYLSDALEHGVNAWANLFNVPNSITRVGSTATYAYNPGRGGTQTARLREGDTFVISGADQPEYNGTFTISNLVVPSGLGDYTFDFTVSGTPATPATGSIKGYSNRSSFAIGDMQETLDQTLFNFKVEDAWAAPNASLPTTHTRTSVGLHADGWRRQKPREISSTSDTADTDGNTAATGHKAWHTGIPTVVYEYDGASWITEHPSKFVSSITRSGSTATATTSTAHGYTTGDWVRITKAAQSEYNGDFEITVTGATTFTYEVEGTPVTPATGLGKSATKLVVGPVDVLDSDLAAPFHVPYGKMQAGDYVRGHIFQELRDVMNQLLVPIYRAAAGVNNPVGAPGWNTDENNVRAGSGSNQAAAEADFAADTPSNAAGNPPEAVSLNTTNDIGGATLDRTHNYLKHTNVPLSGVTRNASFYARVSAPSGSPTEFQSHGDTPPGAVSSGDYVLIKDFGPTTAGTLTSDKVGLSGSSDLPGWGTVDTLVGYRFTSSANEMFMLLDFGVSGGFTYQP